MEQYNWIIAISNSDADNILIAKFHGNKEEVKEKLLEFINKDRENNADLWDHGCETVNEITAKDNGGFDLYGYGSYVSHHIDYAAKEVSHILTIC